MAFDEVNFPLKLSALSVGGPCFSTDVVTLENGVERRNQNWSQARRRYDAGTGMKGARDAALLAAFFQARAGRARGFRLKDWMDFSSALDGIGAASFKDQALGTGNGSTTVFQLKKTYGASYVREIVKPEAGSVRVGVDGAEWISGWSVEESTGLVTFATAPTLGQTLTAGFLFDVPVRFDTDELSLAGHDKNMTSATVPLIEVRPT